MKKQQLQFDGLPPKQKQDNTKKREWERGFQKWSDEQCKDESTPLGKCGYGSCCNYCKDTAVNNPCIKALRSMCKDLKITIDYEKQTYQEIWEL
nr:MAG TPA: hypothetical protein [Caudoviricetes sp.]